MSEILQRIHDGNGWLVTFVGMAGVFAALLAIYAFIAWLRRLMKMYDRVRRKGRPKEEHPAERPAAAGDRIEAGGDDAEGAGELAAVAAAAFLVLRTRTGRSAGHAVAHASGWRTSGRLDLMKWPERRASRGR